jgi:hypothetical protein
MWEGERKTLARIQAMVVMESNSKVLFYPSVVLVLVEVKDG